jgi:hypothetical protein
MQKAGVSTRTPADDNRRGMDIAVTDVGRVALLAAIESHVDLLASLFSDRLTTTDRTAQDRVLVKLLTDPKLTSAPAHGRAAHRIPGWLSPTPSVAAAGRHPSVAIFCRPVFRRR